MQVRPGKAVKPLKPAEGYGHYEFDDLDQVIENFIKPIFDEGSYVVVEPKWDGVRLVVHYDSGNFHAFTEDRQRDRAEILPELEQAVVKLLGDRSAIIDGELLLGRIVDGKFKPVMRPDMMKVVVGKEPITEPIRFCAFDLLYLDGEDLTDLPLHERREKLEQLLSNPPETIILTPQKIVRTVEEAREAIEWAASFIGSEGAMIKDANSVYELDGRSTNWAKYKRWKSLKCLIIGISKVFPPNTDPDNWKQAFRESQTYIFRCAVLGPDGKTLIPIESKRTLTPSDLELRYVRSGEEDPVTGKVASKSEWRGRDDYRLWTMDERFPNRDVGELAYGQTYAIKLEQEPQLGDVVEVAPISLNWFADEDGFVHLTWMHPRALRAGVDDPSEVADWDRVTELILASGQEVPSVTVADGKLKLSGNTVESSISVMARKDENDEDEADGSDSDENVPVWQRKMLPRLLKIFGLGFARVIVRACVALLPDDYDTYVDLFSGVNCGLLRLKERRPGEKEILVDIDPYVVNFLRVIKSGDWVKLRRYRWNPSKERWSDLREGLINGDFDDADSIKKAYVFGYTTFYCGAGYGYLPKYNSTKEMRYYWRRELERFWDRCALWEQRLKGVALYCMDALDAMQKFDGKRTFFFADPPWVSEETEKGKALYQFSWTAEDFERFMEACNQLTGRILLLNESFARKFQAMSDKWHYRELDYVIQSIPWLVMRKKDIYKEGSDLPLHKLRIFLIGNYELPEIPKPIREEALRLLSSSEISEEEELTHEEQRLEEEKRLGDPMKVVHDVKKFEQGYEFVYMRHYRGLWSDSERKEIASMLKKLKNADDDEREQIWQELVKTFGVYWLTIDFDKLVKLAQKASDERKDVSKVLSDHLSQDLPPDMRIDELEDWIVNVASVHGDLRIVNPAAPSRQLIGWTLFTPAVALQFLDGTIAPVLRDKFINNEDGDRIVATKKARQPYVWLTVVTEKEPLLWAPPGAVGSTKATWSMFEWKANGVVWFGVQRPDYHEFWMKFEEWDDDVEPRDGKWVVRLLEGQGPKIGGEGPYWQFWYPEGDGQLPYVLTHTPAQAKREWKGRKYEYVILNLDVVPIVLEQFEHISELAESKRKVQERSETLDEWKELERY
jgi:site-specific DNA-adenine methylase